MKILLLSAYDAPSHKRWRQGLVSHCDSHDWTCLSLPPRYFNWRVRGNSLSWAFSQRSLLEQDYDLLIATSMVDLSALRGFVPKLGSVATLVYCHENQFDYPVSKQTQSSSGNRVEPQILSIYSALCADRVVFNSDYNRRTFLDGAAKLLKKLPDQVPAGIVDDLAGNTSVVPVPLESSCFQQTEVEGEALGQKNLTLIWNHRWEFDKGPDRLLLLVRELVERAVKFRLHVVGQQFRQQPDEFQAIKALLQQSGSLGEWGFVISESEYRRLLRCSHLVISTALHDFQGLSVLEAVASGCVPLLPRRQAYPEWFGEEACYSSNIGSPEREAQSLADRVEQFAGEFYAGQQGALAPQLSHFSWQHLHGQYEALFKQVVDVTDMPFPVS